MLETTEVDSSNLPEGMESMSLTALQGELNMPTGLEESPSGGSDFAFAGVEPIVWAEATPSEIVGAPQLYYPIINLGRFSKSGADREIKQFYPNERDLLLHALTNEICEHVFGVPRFLERFDSKNGGCVMSPNPAFKELPTQPM